MTVSFIPLSLCNLFVIPILQWISRLLYSDFIMDNTELMFHSSADTTPTFQDDRGFTHCAIPVFRSEDPDLARDPLSTNRRLPETADLEMFETMVVAGPTPDQIYVLIPDSIGPSVEAESPADLQHVVGLSLGSADNLSSTLPSEGRQLSVLLPGHPGQYGSSLASLSYRLPVFLALSGVNLPDVVLVRA